MKLSLKQIDEIRKNGLRPQVVGVFVRGNKVLMVYKRKHDLWQMPQGGVDNGETLEEAFKREMREELGSSFMEGAKDLEIIGEDEIIFSSKKQNSRELKTDEGEEFYMRGKKYFFMMSKVENTDLDIGESEFDDYKWVSYGEASELAEKIYQKNKKEMTEKILQILNSKDII